MTMFQCIVKILLRQLVLIFKHIQATNVVSISNHFSHGPTFMYWPTLYWLEKILAQSKCVELEVHTEELVDNIKYSHFLRSFFTKWFIWTEFYSIIQSLTITRLQQGHSTLQPLVVIPSPSIAVDILVGKSCGPMCIPTDSVYARDEPISFRRAKVVINCRVQGWLCFVGACQIILWNEQKKKGQDG